MQAEPERLHYSLHPFAVFYFFIRLRVMFFPPLFFTGSARGQLLITFVAAHAPFWLLRRSFGQLFKNEMVWHIVMPRYRIGISLASG